MNEYKTKIVNDNDEEIGTLTVVAPNWDQFDAAVDRYGSEHPGQYPSSFEYTARQLPAEQVGDVRIDTRRR